MWLFPKGPRNLFLASPVDAILASGLSLAAPDSDLEPFYPHPSNNSLLRGHPSAFLSHTTADVHRIRGTVYPELEPYFGSIFLLNIGMAAEAGWRGDTVQIYKRNILRLLWQSDWVVVYLTSAAIASTWVQFELAWSLQNKKRNRIIVLLPETSAATAKLKPALRLVWQVPIRSAPWWNHRMIRYALRGSGARPTGP